MLGKAAFFKWDTCLLLVDVSSTSKGNRLHCLLWMAGAPAPLFYLLQIAQAQVLKRLLLVAIIPTSVASCIWRAMVKNFHSKLITASLLLKRRGFSRSTKHAGLEAILDITDRNTSIMHTHPNALSSAIHQTQLEFEGPTGKHGANADSLNFSCPVVRRAIESKTSQCTYSFHLSVMNMPNLQQFPSFFFLYNWSLAWQKIYFWWKIIYTAQHCVHHSHSVGKHSVQWERVSLWMLQNA